jgi:hypothetical protein
MQHSRALSGFKLNYQNASSREKYFNDGIAPKLQKSERKRKKDSASTVTPTVVDKAAVTRTDVDVWDFPCREATKSPDGSPTIVDIRDSPCPESTKSPTVIPTIFNIPKSTKRPYGSSTRPLPDMTPLPLDIDRLPEILVPRNQCGLDWCFDFHGTEVSNTCGLDSALMSVYLRWKYCGLRWNIPTNEPNSKELVLLDVLMLIDATDNDARQYWCKRMLGWKIVTNVSLYGEIPPVFHDHVRFLFNGNRQMHETQSSFRTIEVHIHVLGSASSINQGFVDGYCVSEG